MKKAFLIAAVLAPWCLAAHAADFDFAESKVQPGNFLELAAGFNGSIQFTKEERAQHEKGVSTIVKVASDCLKASLEHHQTFFQQHGISPYYGDRSEFGKLTDKGRKEYLRAHGFDPNLEPQLEPSSCVGLTLKCLGEGFHAAHQDTLWNRLRAYTMKNGVDGTALQAGLQKLGWKILYWNPDVRKNVEWDREEHAKDPVNKSRFWGFHEESWKSAQKGLYLFNKVDDARLLVNFGTVSPAFLKSVPFFVGTAHGGYHVFPGAFGQVVEAHSTRMINDPKTLESAEFNPLAGLAPTDGEYHSGLIAVPGKFLR